jgi:hypothetical protein
VGLSQRLATYGAHGHLRTLQVQYDLNSCFVTFMAEEIRLFASNLQVFFSTYRKLLMFFCTVTCTNWPRVNYILSMQILRFFIFNMHVSPCITFTS